MIMASASGGLLAVIIAVWAQVVYCEMALIAFEIVSGCIILHVS